MRATDEPSGFNFATNSRDFTSQIVTALNSIKATRLSSGDQAIE